MKWIYYTLAILILPCVLFYKPIIMNNELFDLGLVLKFQNCLTDNVDAGQAGDGIIWDFSNLTSLSDTLTEWMVDPAKTPYGVDYPDANLVEKYSDGRFVIANQTMSDSHLLAFVDSQQDIEIKYNDPALFAVRPINYLLKDSSTFSNEFTSSGFDFKGSGTSYITVDGFGTLILPNATYENVLRVKIVQDEHDTLIQFGTVTENTTTTYAWFESSHQSALLKIDSNHNQTFDIKSVSYLLSEEMSGVRNENNPDFGVYPNPLTNSVNFELPQAGTVSLIDQSGNAIKALNANEGQNTISAYDIASGVYFAVYQYGTHVLTKKFIIIK